MFVLVQQLSNVQYRRLVCYCRLQEVIDPGHRQRVTQHHREVLLFNDILLVFITLCINIADLLTFKCNHASEGRTLRKEINFCLISFFSELILFSFIT